MSTTAAERDQQLVLRNLRLKALLYVPAWVFGKLVRMRPTNV